MMPSYKELQSHPLVRGNHASRYARIRELRQEFVNEEVMKLLKQGAKPVDEAPGYYVFESGVVYGSHRGRITKLRPGVKPGGYEFVGLRANGLCMYKMVHRLVAAAFIPNPNNLTQVNHKDLNKRNNSARNLEWCTAKQNTSHMMEALGIKRGSNHFRCKLTPEQVVVIRLAKGTYRKIGSDFGVSAQTICNVKRKSKYADVL